ncbi:hypothetical protein NU688_18785 [Variovorax sp. ZS18.2.2]|uniref:hypothetical protein n=1 Tax=Variovorax sp. ZS18.2.2 TaxID=2971255 RepID=UPI002151F659|nr:hypothetical protein [Variovorax sp. ZS18.2.2]MCR6478215.1 hypothetical protein [Variovorax sp. ZS18.2.2]
MNAFKTDCEPRIEMRPGSLPHARTLTLAFGRRVFSRVSARWMQSQAFWIGLSLAMPIAALVAWYLFDSRSFGTWMRSERAGWLVLASVVPVVLLYVVRLAMLMREWRPGQRPP